MIPKMAHSPYRINLIRELREREKKKERQKRITLIIAMGCFGFFLMAMIYSGLTIWQMENVLKNESAQVERLQQEYRKYTASRLIVDKADIEQLDGLKGKGMFWTKKLASLAKHLPEDYFITGFSYQNGALNVLGIGSASYQQDHLLVLDDYLNQLRRDTVFSESFTKVQLNSAEHKNGSGKIDFNFSAFTRTWKAQ